MSTILVVDDSLVDRRFVGGLLSEDGRWDIDYAVDGANALELIDQTPPDLVISDLLMPRIDGLQLVATLRRRHPLIPVILMTSQGSEEIAVQALQQGAASYVPKRAIATYLVDTVQKVLGASGRQRCENRLMDCMTHSETTFVLDNDPSLFSPLVARLQEGTVQMGICDETDRTRIGVALEEALANALYHGNLEIGSELRESDFAAYHKMVEVRRGQVPYRDRRIEVHAWLSPQRAVFTVRDEGRGFDPATLPDPTDPANIAKASGRGVLLMRAFMDDLRYDPPGNKVTLVKRRAGCLDGAGPRAAGRPAEPASEYSTGNEESNYELHHCGQGDGNPARGRQS